MKSLKCLYRSLVPCDVTGWYLIFDVVTLTNILVTWPWHIYTWYLACYTWHLIPDTWYNNTWQLTCYHSLDMLSPGTSTLDRYCDTWLVTVIPGTCIILHIHDYYFYGDFAWLLYCYQIFGTPELLYSWTPVLLNSCIPEPL